MRVLKQSRGHVTRENIVRKAARLFALKGYHDTKLEEILRAADVTTGAFFHHFHSKEDLAFAVIDSHMRRRRRQLERIVEELPPTAGDEPLQGAFRWLDALEVMVHQRAHRKGGCIIGNLSTALSDTHESFRQRLAECFDEMALEFKPHLDAAARKYCPGRRVDTIALARYIVAIVEGSIMLERAQKEQRMIERHFAFLKEYLKASFGA